MTNYFSAPSPAQIVRVNHSEISPVIESINDTVSDAEIVRSDDVKMKHLMQKMHSVEKVTKQMVKAMRESNRYLYSILRNQKLLLKQNFTDTKM